MLIVLLMTCTSSSVSVQHEVIFLILFPFITHQSFCFPVLQIKLLFPLSSLRSIPKDRIAKTNILLVIKPFLGCPNWFIDVQTNLISHHCLVSLKDCQLLILYLLCLEGCQVYFDISLQWMQSFFIPLNWNNYIKYLTVSGTVLFMGAFIACVS